MNDIATIRVDELVDGQTLRVSSIIFLIVATLVLMSDGYDIAAMGYVAPELVKVWHVSPSQLVQVFSAGIFGLLFGAPLFSLIGDNFGRKKAILAALVVFGLLSLLTIRAHTLGQLAILRFFTSLGLGGVIPTVTALVAELAPKRMRGRLVVVVLFGVTAGIAVPGFVAASLVPRFGWAVLLFVGGIFPLVMAGIGYFVLPESVKFVAQQKDRASQLRQLARLIRPDLLIGDQTSITSATDLVPTRGSPHELFRTGLAVITPLFWIVLATNQMANFFSLTWLPMLLQSAGSTTSQAGISASLFSIGGLAGGMCLIFLIDRFGVLPLVGLFLLGTPFMAALGLRGLTSFEHGLIIAGAGFCVTGINFGVNAAVGLIYPTSIRSTGIGWCQAAGRIGAICAPLAGGALLAWRVPMDKLPLAPALVLGIGALSSAVLSILCIRRFRGLQLDEHPSLNA